MRTLVSAFGLLPYRIGGMESLIRETALALDERGWRSIVVFAGEPTREVRQYLDVPGLTIEVLPGFDRNSWGALPALNSLLRRSQAQCMHFHFTDLLNPAFLLARLHHTRCFVTIHRSLPENYQPHTAPAWKRAVARTVLAPVERVFCVSDFVHRSMQATGYFHAEQLCRVYNGVSLPGIQRLAILREKYRTFHGIPENAPVVLQVGQLIPEKGVEDLLEAAPGVLERFPLAKFVFLGDGPGEQRFRERAASLQIEHAVTWAGVDADPCHNGAFAAADVVCAPARWQEAFGFAIAEAMSHGTPVVATRVGGIEEIVVHGETGFLVERRNPGELGRRIGELLSSPDFRRQMGFAGYERANSVFNLRNTVRQMLDICRISDDVRLPAVVLSKVRSKVAGS
jgi:glycosyltransferase involved in cell wall biosynthesis